ncbi:light-harvesting complex-like protein 3 isotype 1, chloroplastic [Apium graveolens]|uniref:light-harvesting complex-like protein 3 isotype 1, chloroplastic n=1 Tax=Apium graveolens TaxID=4045 RepID=UPI003D7B3748
MASLSVTVSMQKACSTAYFMRKHKSVLKPSCSVATKQAAAPIESAKSLNLDDKSGEVEAQVAINKDTEDAHEPEFFDARWKEGTWDLNMFVNKGKMDWDSVISAEARRRKFVQVHPAVSTNESPVLFKTSIIPWWAWVTHFHLPQAELLNGRAAMIGFFMGYIVDVLTGLNVVSQTGNFICKAGLFVTIIGILVFRRSNDRKLKKMESPKLSFENCVAGLASH